jgi:hypothetical protein
MNTRRHVVLINLSLGVATTILFMFCLRACHSWHVSKKEPIPPLKMELYFLQSTSEDSLIIKDKTIDTNVDYRIWRVKDDDRDTTWRYSGKDFKGRTLVLTPVPKSSFWVKYRVVKVGKSNFDTTFPFPQIVSKTARSAVGTVINLGASVYPTRVYTYHDFELNDTNQSVDIVNWFVDDSLIGIGKSIHSLFRVPKFYTLFAKRIGSTGESIDTFQIEAIDLAAEKIRLFMQTCINSHSTPFPIRQYNEIKSQFFSTAVPSVTVYKSHVYLTSKNFDDLVHDLYQTRLNGAIYRVIQVKIIRKNLQGKILNIEIHGA